MATTLAELNAANKAAAKAIWQRKQVEVQYNNVTANYQAALQNEENKKQALLDCISDLDPSVGAGL